jgi:hypothetical protein
MGYATDGAISIAPGHDPFSEGSRIRDIPSLNRDKNPRDTQPNGAYTGGSLCVWNGPQVF